LSVEIAKSPLPPFIKGEREVISADSRQIYTQMSIGTDKISEEIRNEIPHHLIDIVNPDERYTAGQWKQDATRIIEEIHARGNIPMIVGGTGLYIDTIYKNFAMSEVAPQMEWRDEMMKKEQEKPGFLFSLLYQKDPEEAQKHHENSVRYILRALEICEFTGKTKSEQAQQQPVQRPLLMIGLWREKEETNMRINARIKEMFAGGLVEEVKELLDLYGADAPGMQAIGYKEVVDYLQGHYNREKAIETLKRNSHHLAKKQRTRFRRYITDAKVQPKANVEYVVEML
jgi:tRNA dimethylallyltransferase